MSAALLWLALTLALYAAARWLHRRFPRPWLSPLLVVPVVMVAGLLALHVPYPAYMKGGRWLLDLLGPTTVAFAVPLYRHRALLRRHAVEVAAGVATGCTVAVLSSVALARWIGLPELVARSMATRSITTPLAMVAAGTLGAAPALAAVFVVVTGVVGAVVGALLVHRLPLRSPIARGALLGMGAHGAGTQRAMELGPVEGTIASLVMIVAGLTVVVVAPLIAPWLG
ncbi:MAG: LrgB family protein [Anaeromyxobacter sp.]